MVEVISYFHYGPWQVSRKESEGKEEKKGEEKNNLILSPSMNT